MLLHRRITKSLSTVHLLSGINQKKMKTDRLEVAYLEAGTGNIALILIHGNCSSSHFFQDFMLALAAKGHYIIYALDMRGYGDSEVLPVDATRGVRDFSDDLNAFVQALNLNFFHLLGWSLGGNIVMQYVIDHPGKISSLTLESPGSPFGFGGTKDAKGTPTWPDFAGSGGGTANPEFTKRIAEGDRGNEQFSPRTVINTFYYKPPFRTAPDREEINLSSLLTTKVTPGNYPGDMIPSDNWPNVGPGKLGVNNALSPKYMNQSNFANITAKPPLLWMHGADDQIVSDTSFFDFGFLGQIGAVPGWPGVDTYPPQPMKTQVRTVLERYKTNSGELQEVQLVECGHSPHVEKLGKVCELFDSFIQEHDRNFHF
jgi:pimeloyl-ACP methyl ester carboxylesterase